ncbi:hypothetical protein V6R21_31495 [Limibacter armeniacum]|uniref:hypothetical protein n=1 Tax=Limibacter armeniacum TaxID=466084 RepID=UPI002FE547BC
MRILITLLLISVVQPSYTQKLRTYHESDLIFVGSVVSSTESITEIVAFNGQQVIFRIDKLIKGNIDEKVMLFSPMHLRDVTVDRFLHQGDQWLVYAKGNQLLDHSRCIICHTGKDAAMTIKRNFDAEIQLLTALTEKSVVTEEDENGTIVARFSEGKPHGIWTIYNKRKVVERVIHYDDGYMVLQQFYTRGKLNKLEMYDSGGHMDRVVYYNEKGKVMGLILEQ